jgi:hypothetical protein
VLGLGNSRATVAATLDDIQRYSMNKNPLMHGGFPHT